MDQSAEIISALQQRIERIEGRNRTFSLAPEDSEKTWTTGLTSLDTALPGASLPFDGCHDFTPLAATDMPQVAGFVLCLLRCLPRTGSIVWCQTRLNVSEYGRLYGPGLAATNFSPSRLLFVTVPKERDLAFVLEETVRARGVAAVVAEGPALDFTQTRRLTLAAQASGVPSLLINSGKEIGASAALTRWRIAPIAGPPSHDDPEGPGFPAWSLTLARARGGRTELNPTAKGPLEVFWNDETHSFHLVSEFRDGTILYKPQSRPTISAINRERSP